MLDFDGVIVDSLDVTFAAVARTLREHSLGHLATREAFLSFVDDNWYEGVTRAGVPAHVSTAIDSAVAEALAAQLTDLRVVPGMKATIATLSASHTVVVITSNFSTFVSDFLEANCVAGISRVLGADEDVSKVRKIQSALSLLARSNLGWYVGDTVGDIVEARTAGARSIAATWGWHPSDRLEAAFPTAIANAPRDLLSIIDEAR